MAGTLEGSSEQPIDISSKKIKEIDDFCDAFDIAENLDVDLEGLADLEEMKERMMMELQKRHPGFINYKEKICREMRDYKRDDNNKRGKLHDLLTQTKTKFLIADANSSEGISVIEKALKTEGFVKNLGDEFCSRQETIQKGECCIVVAGETAAGKYLFLNLILGEDIRTSKHGFCTSVITRLSYGKTKHARVIYHDKNRPDDVYDDIDHGEIPKLVYEENLDKRETTSDIKEVQIFLPAKLLESGMVLIYTPGIGENDGMDVMVEKFVDENQVTGFIYVIKSDNGGGVNEDRLVKLMKIILLKENTKGEKGTFRFDPSCAMFICNKWDSVNEKDKVYKHIVDRLHKIWPKFDEEKVKTISSYKAKNEIEIDQDYITPDFQDVLNILRNIYSQALNKRVKVTYKWMKTLLLRSVHHTTTMVKQLNCSDDKMMNKMKEANENFEKLKNESVGVITSLRDMINNKSYHICGLFREYLQEPVVRMAITQWIEQELPSEYILDQDGEPTAVKKEWIEFKTEIDSLIIERIAIELDKWEEENGTIDLLETLVINEIQQKVLGLTNEVTKVETDLHSSKPASRRDRRRETVCDKMQLEDNQYYLSVLARSKVFQPMKKAMRIFPGANKWKVYASNKCAYAKGRSEKLLKTFTEPCRNKDDSLKIVIDCFMEGAKETLDKSILEIPNLIKSNQDIFSHVLTCKRDVAKNLRVYEEMMKELQVLKGLLADYGAGYIFIEDFKPNELQIIDPNDATGRSTTPFKISEFLMNMSSSQTSTIQQCPRGLWTAHQRGLQKRENREEKVTIKMYLPSCNIDKCYSEIAKLRLLEHSNVAEFLGIQNSESYFPAMVYNKPLRTLRHQYEKHSGQLNISNLLQEVTMGLQYLHRHGMVHMELNMNTVMLDSTGNIRLTGGCLPRKADLQGNQEQHISGDFVYLSPEVLRGDLYTASADVYAFGLLMFDMMSKTPAFDSQRKMSLDLFIKRINPKEMISLKTEQSNLSDDAIDIILRCLDISEESRPTLLNLQEQVEVLKTDQHAKHQAI
ncbi:uncharacterized protein LOC143066878 isoform X2 [Mytilus galloprovincialis]|uniref:uncharacterized protein LOC143066878 isoform X2 n=1 Tax=Mytilus galloprovincialis TaxID=29158 RepID=UPI003F7C34ED